jgi:7-cyano-7-deazaguanine synthase
MQALLIERRPVQPIHVLDTGRGSALFELRTMQRMRAALLPRLADPLLLRPMTIVLASDYPPPPEQVARGGRIQARAHMGSQYVWLTGPAEAMGWRDVEISLERLEHGLNAWQRMVFRAPGTLNDSDEAQLFKYWAFPVMHLTKTEMREIAREHGFLDVLLARWFCFNPVFGKPCGRCRPCKSANRDGVRYANPAVSAARDALRRLDRALDLVVRQSGRPWRRAGEAPAHPDPAGDVTSTMPA